MDSIGYQQLIDCLQLRVFWKDRDAVFLGCNRLFAEESMITVDEIRGMTDFDFPWKRADAELYRKVDREVMDSDQAKYNIIEPQIQKDGSEVWLETTKVPLHDSKGAVIGVFCCYDIVTERVQSDRGNASYRQHLEMLVEEQTLQRQQLEKLIPEAQKTESLRLMASGISHDFNNMLAAIMALAESIQVSANEPAAVRQIGQKIVSSCQVAAELCGQLSVFSGNVLEKERHVNLNALVEQMLPLLSASLKSQAKLDVSLSPESPICRGVTSKIQQIILNLVVNASEATPAGGEIKLRTGVEECSSLRLDIARLNCSTGSGRYSFVEITDSGRGISAEAQKRIFDPFYTTGKLGRGLGLAAVSGIVAALQGAIELVTDVGQGTTFRVLLPSVPPEADEGGATVSQASLEHQPTVMLVDDNEGFVEALTYLLTSQKCRVLAHQRGRPAIEEFRGCVDEVDAVVLDIQMPEMDGLAVMRELRALKPELAIVVITGCVEQHSRQELREMTNVFLLEKPFPLGALTEILAKIMPPRKID